MVRTDNNNKSSVVGGFLMHLKHARGQLNLHHDKIEELLYGVGFGENYKLNQIMCLVSELLLFND